MREAIVIGLIGASLVVLSATTAFAQRYESDNYTIDASVGNSFGGDSSSAGYNLVSSGGESVIGNGAGGSYVLGQGYIAQLEKSLRLTVQPAGLKAYYPFEEAQGSLTYDGSLGSNAQLIGDPVKADGIIGRALTFDGSDDRAVITNLDLNGISTVTLAAWAKVDAGQDCSAGLNPIISGGASAQNGLYVSGANCSIIGLKGASGATVDGIHPVELAGFDPYEWNYYAGVSSESGLYLYVNGQLVGSNTTSFVPIDIVSDMEVGHNPTSASRYFDGTIDEVKIYARSLSAVEVEAEYEAGLEGVSAGLVFPDNIVSGTSQTVEARAVVLTDAPSYTLNISQNNDLTSGSSTIPAVSGTIASPVTWNEGATKGLGFTISALSMGSVPAKWQLGEAYASLPSTSTSVYTRSGFGGGSKDVVDIRYRLDVTSSQPSEKYKNTVTYTGVIIP